MKNGLLDMSKPADRKKAASILASYGRGGDTEVAHINTDEAARLKAMGGSGTINPKTGLLEFMDEDGQGTSETAATGAGTQGYDSVGGGYGGVTGPGGKDEGARANDAKGAAAPGQGPHSAGTYDTHGYGNLTLAGYRTGIPGLGWMGRKADEAIANPFATLVDLAVPGVLGFANMAAKAATGKSVGGAVTGFARDVTNYGQPGGLSLASMTAPAGNPSQPATPSDPPNSPDRGDYGPSGSKDSPLSGGLLAQQQPADVARGALSKALLGSPGAPNAYNGWNGNQFVVGGFAQPWQPSGLLQSNFGLPRAGYAPNWGAR